MQDESWKLWALSALSALAVAIIVIIILLAYKKINEDPDPDSQNPDEEYSDEEEEDYSDEGEEVYSDEEEGRRGQEGKGREGKGDRQELDRQKAYTQKDSDLLKKIKKVKEVKKFNKRGKTPKIISIPKKSSNRALIKSKKVVRKSLPKVESDVKCKAKKASQNKYEKLCSKVLQEIYGKEFKSYRPAFLRNPETGNNLELDCYNEEIGIAVEYNGIQHYVYPNWAHKSRLDFHNQVRRDMFKKEMCDYNGVYLISVPYTVDFDLIPDYIRSQLPDNYPVDGQSRGITQTSQPSQPFQPLEQKQFKDSNKRQDRGTRNNKRQQFFHQHHIQDPSFVPF